MPSRPDAKQRRDERPRAEGPRDEQPSDVPPRDERGEVVVSDVRGMRALAHPARLAVLDALASGNELTATQCAELAGLSPSAMSYHLRALEKWGLVERVPSVGDARERPWRSAGRGIRIASSRATEAVEVALLDTVMDTDRQAMADFLARGEREPAAWRDTMGVARTVLWLTPDETSEVAAAIQEVLDRYRPRRDPSLRPPGARRVRVSSQIVPLDEPPPEAPN